MALRPRTTEELVRKLSAVTKLEATRSLTEFYARAKFKTSRERFDRQYVDGQNDGGIDFYEVDGTTFFIVQTKFLSNPTDSSTDDVLDEVKKIRKTLSVDNPNDRATDFVNAVKREVLNPNATIEILWLTTNKVPDAVIEEVVAYLKSWRSELDWKIGIEFVTVDHRNLQSVIYDVEHGFVPYTGRKTLDLSPNQWFQWKWEETGVQVVVCNVLADDILKWFRDSDDIDRFLEKNVRGYLGDKPLNRAISKSYEAGADWFWYKHNGVIIFADTLHVDTASGQLTLRNPQIVNGGQTVKSLFEAFDKRGRTPNGAHLLLRVYRLPYEDARTYERSIEIISALNSQNKIYWYDLRSTDPRQVRLDELFSSLPSSYHYFRKRTKYTKSSRFGVTMVNLALRYYVCRRHAPHEGAIGNVDTLFEETSKYDEVFDEPAIRRELDGRHIVIKYATCWNLDQALQRASVAKQYWETLEWTRWYVLAELYARLMDWKDRRGQLDYRKWLEFVESYAVDDVVQQYSRWAFKEANSIIPAKQEARKYLRTKEAALKFTSRMNRYRLDPLLERAWQKVSSAN